MRLTPERRRELKAILALAVGVFIGLSLLPTALTGPLGRSFGSLLWKTLGLGSALIPVLLIGMGLAGFGWLAHLDLRRTAILFGGLVLLVLGRHFQFSTLELCPKSRFRGSFPRLLPAG